MPPGSPQQISCFRLVLAVVLLTGMASACGNRGNEANGWDPEKLADPASYKEGDSFPAAQLPPDISDWLSHYGVMDTGIRIHRLQSPGVPLHIGPLEPASVPQAELAALHLPLMAFSPDSSRAIDFTSYGAFPDTSREGRVSWKGGEADQEVALVLVREGKRMQLMFNGPQSSLEAAGWLSNDACLLGLIQQDEASQRFFPELMLFNFRDSLFTNFRTSADFPMDLLRQQPTDYLEQRIRQLNPPQK